MHITRFLVVLAGLLLIGSVYGQTNTGIIRGTVIDPSGAVVAGSKVTALNTDTGLQYSALTNESGLYSIPDVPAGPYSVTVEHSGFHRSIRQGITLTTGETLALNTTLELGAIAEAVTVTAQTPQVQSETSSIDQLIE